MSILTQKSFFKISGFALKLCIYVLDSAVLSAMKEKVRAIVTSFSPLKIKRKEKEKNHSSPSPKHYL